MGAVSNGFPDSLLKDLPGACADEGEAVRVLERERWGDTPACPRCGVTEVSQLKARDGQRNRRFLWRCHGCRRQFTVRIGTVFEDSRIPLRHWCFAFWAACAHKKGVSALQISRQTKVSYKSALFMMHRIRYAMSDDVSGGPLTGIVEVDETYVGGKPRHRRLKPGKRPGQPFAYTPGRVADSKTPVVAMVERGGRVRARVPGHVTAANLSEVMRANISPDAHLMTDEAMPYRTIGKYFAQHSRVHHTRKEYVRGLASTNTVEGFFSLL